jgi:exonuclease III
MSLGEKQFNLFAVWAKHEDDAKNAFDYEQNVVKAAQSTEYQRLYEQGAVLIGDFNINHEKCDYNALVGNLQGFHDCAVDGVETFCNGRDFYRNDFCFLSDSLLKKARNVYFDEYAQWIIHHPDKISEKIDWKGLSDHCPICVEFEI